MPHRLTPALFLDRDGVINVDKTHTWKREDFEFLPHIFTLVKTALAKGYKVIVVTNQGGIARGLYTMEDFNTLTTWMRQEFIKNEAPLTAVYCCPHHPEYGERITCTCRKPSPGMLKQAQIEHHLDLARSLMIGDKHTDMQAAQAAGLPTRIFIPGFEKTRPVECTHAITSLAEVLPLL